MDAFNSQNISSKSKFLPSNRIRSVCPKCYKENMWQPNGCKSCSHSHPPRFLCLQCNKFLELDYFTFSAKGANEAELSDSIVSDKCPKCKRWFLDDFAKSQIKELSTFIKNLPKEFKIIPDVGYSTKKRLEALCNVTDFSEANDYITRDKGITLKFGEQTKFFRESLDFISKHDHSDFGFDGCQTIKITPGPPYSPSQRETIFNLLLRFRIHSKCENNFWSVHFRDPYFDNDEDQIRGIYSCLKNCLWDKGSFGLLLLNYISNDVFPGRFINTYRLLEYTLNKLIENDIQRFRNDTNVDSEKFIRCVYDINVDLKTKLKRRIERIKEPPKKLFIEMWNILHPDRKINEHEIFSEIAKFRNLNVHGYEGITGDLVLPWEIPNFPKWISGLLEILKLILQNEK